MRDDFAALILTNRRPDRVTTYETLRSNGYTGRIYLVVDDEDPTLDLYRARYGDEVVVFSKAEAAEYTDQADNFPDRRTALWARNACWRIARDLDLRYFIELDDDYTAWSYRWIGRKPGADRADYHGWKIKNLDGVFDALVRFLADTPTSSIALSQGGDHFGGKESQNANIRLLRKVMNSFICDVERPFPFTGRINDDTNTYVLEGRRGTLFFTYTPLQLQQNATQTNPGGMTELYRETGTYVKSFYTVMLAPSCTEIRTMGRTDRRLHHHVRWGNAVPKIISEKHRKARDS